MGIKATLLVLFLGLVAYSESARSPDELKMIVKAVCAVDSAIADRRDKECLMNAPIEALGVQGECTTMAGGGDPDNFCKSALDDDAMRQKMFDCVMDKGKDMPDLPGKIEAIHDCLLKVAS